MVSFLFFIILMRFNFSFNQALDISGLFFLEKYVYHSQFISKFFFGLHNSFLILNYNNSFFCIRRCLNFLESSFLNRSYVLGIGEFYNFFLKGVKFFKYLNILNLQEIPNGFLTNFKQHFTTNKLFQVSTQLTGRKFKGKSKLYLKKARAKFVRVKKFDNRPTLLTRQKRNWMGHRRKLNPPSIGILFNISKSFWILNEFK